MPTTENTAAIRRLVEGLGGDAAALDGVIAPGDDGHIPAAPAGGVLPIEALRHHVAGRRAAFPDLVIASDDVIGEGDTVAVRWPARGTHQGAFHAAPAASAHARRGGDTSRTPPAGDVAAWERGGTADAAAWPTHSW